MKVLTVLGARPQFIKAAAVSRVIGQLPEMEEVIVHTGQHFDHKMSDIFFREMQLPRPDYTLGINSLSHGAMTGRMLEAVEAVIRKEEPQVVLLYGDTNSTLAGALAAAKLGIPVAHIEAGLRSFNTAMPEEINRIVTDRLSSFLFCPSRVAVQNLMQEGFEGFGCHISQPGDVMYDTILHFAPQAEPLPAGQGNYALLTLHRQENIDKTDRLMAIVEAVNQLSEEFRIVFPVHPRTRSKLKECRIKLNFEPIEPVGYLQMLGLLKGSSLVLTDSGGLQKEAYFMQKYCVTLRDETEWTELVEAGCNFLGGAQKEKIVALSHKYFGKEISHNHQLYGRGDAARKICRTLLEEIG